jgi:hypothetical protein
VKRTKQEISTTEKQKAYLNTALCFLMWLRFPAAQTSFACGNDKINFNEKNSIAKINFNEKNSMTKINVE